MHFKFYVLLHSIFYLAHGKNQSLSERGLVYVVWGDEDIWNSDTSPLTWYYNYGAYPSPNIDEDKLQFVPMLWGNRPEDAGFYDTVKGLIDGGMNINYVLGFNEPDGCDGGSSCVDAQTAAKKWKKEIEPLKKDGVRLGAPVVRGGGSVWLQEFYTHCAGECTTDFMTAHWYGDAAGLAGWVDYLTMTYANVTTMWVTEFAYPGGTLLSTQEAFNESIAFLDEQSYITHYSYFGAFPSNEANSYVGPNVAMLNRGGKLTDIGAWYLGMKATGIRPKSGEATGLKITWWHPLAIAATVLMMIELG